jgi:hypothetical protein
MDLFLFLFFFENLTSAVEPATCPPQCSNHGKCVDGVCECLVPWGGPGCDQYLLNRSPYLRSLFSFFFWNLIFLNAFNCSLIYYVVTDVTGQTMNQEWYLNATLPNQAFLEFVVSNMKTIGKRKEGYGREREDRCYLFDPLHVWKFNEDQTSVMFANTTSVLGAGMLKLAFQIRNWPFYSFENSLEVILGSTVSSSQSTSEPCTQVLNLTNIHILDINLKLFPGGFQ